MRNKDQKEQMDIMDFNACDALLTLTDLLAVPAFSGRGRRRREYQRRDKSGRYCRGDNHRRCLYHQRDPQVLALKGHRQRLRHLGAEQREHHNGHLPIELGDGAKVTLVVKDNTTNVLTCTAANLTRGQQRQDRRYPCTGNRLMTIDRASGDTTPMPVADGHRSLRRRGYRRRGNSRVTPTCAARRLDGGAGSDGAWNVADIKAPLAQRALAVRVDFTVNPQRMQAPSL